LSLIAVVSIAVHRKSKEKILAPCFFNEIDNKREQERRVEERERDFFFSCERGGGRWVNASFVPFSVPLCPFLNPGPN